MAFDTLKEKLTNPHKLAYADYHMLSKLYKNASSTGLAAVLTLVNVYVDLVVFTRIAGTS